MKGISFAAITACLIAITHHACGSEPVDLSSLDLSVSTCGWGESKAGRSISGNSLKIAGKVFEKGVGTHSPGCMAILLDGKAERFTALVGVDDWAGEKKGSVVFKVMADGREIFSSGLMKGGDEPKTVDVKLDGVFLLKLIVEDGGDYFSYDHADWADAKLFVNDGQPVMLPAGNTEEVIEAYRKPARRSVLKTAGVEYRLRQSFQGLDCEYFGLSSKSPSNTVFSMKLDQRFQVEGCELKPVDLEVTSFKMNESAADKQELVIVQKHRVLPLEVTTRLTAWGLTGVITRQTSLKNTGSNILHIQEAASMCLPLPAGEYELMTLQGAWGLERQVVLEKLSVDRKFESTAGRSTAKMSPWFCLQNKSDGISYAGQLAWSGNWKMDFIRAPGSHVNVVFNEYFDNGGPALLEPGSVMELPAAAFTCAKGNFDDAANALHRYQRKFVVPGNPANEPPLVQFNSWYPFSGKTEIDEMKRYVDAAADLGTEVFVLDAGWYNKKNWSREVGDWRPDLKAFPRGTAELAKHAHSRGIKFGIWVEIECLGIDSETGKKYAEKWCLRKDGKPIVISDRRHLDFGKPEVRDWARGEMDRIIKEHDLDWVKIDYNINVGSLFERQDGTHPGNILQGHLRGYYRWLDELRAAYPKLIIENCASGGLRFDLGILAHTHTTWISDMTLPKPSLQLAYGSTMEFTPQVCNHWMVGDREDGTVLPDNPQEWWDFMFRVPMNGQFGISSKIVKWGPELKQRAKDNIAMYKRLRSIIANGDCYHLTPPPPSRDPKGWMAIQFVAEDARRSVVMVYRLGESEPALQVKLRGLDTETQYNIVRDGKQQSVMSGKALVNEGVNVGLDVQWRSTVIEIEAVK